MVVHKTLGSITRKENRLQISGEINEGDTVRFHMKTECTSFGSRESGRRAKTKIDNHLSCIEGSMIEFDFDGVLLVSSGFADEVFGRLFAELGAMRFTQQVSFKNLDSTVASLIDRAIAQRTKTTLDNGKGN